MTKLSSNDCFPFSVFKQVVSLWMPISFVSLKNRSCNESSAEAKTYQNIVRHISFIRKPGNLDLKKLQGPLEEKNSFSGRVGYVSTVMKVKINIWLEKSNSFPLLNTLFH